MRQTRIHAAAETLRGVARELRDDPATCAVADFAERGAQMIDRAGSYLEQTSLEKMFADARRFSRERPLVVAAAGIAAGIVASRLLKATAAPDGRVIDYGA
jgi:hypothetical protein